MADTDTETETAPPPAAAPGAMSPDDITKLIHGLLAPSNTPVAKAAPVDTEANAPTSWAGILGEHLAGGPPDVVDLTKEQRESAGRRALLNWSAGMMSVGPFDTLGQGLAAGTRAAQESQYTSEGLEAQRQVSAQDRQQQQVVNQINAATAAGPLMTVQLALARLKAMQGLPNPLAGPGSGTPGTAPGTQIMPVVARDPKAGTAGQQGFNPGNVMADTGLPPGAIGRIPVAGGRYVAAFPDLTTGIAANAANLASYAANGVQTVRDAVKRWVGDPAADLTSYTADVSKALGVKPDDKIDLTDPKVQSAFILAQQPHESGKLWLTPDAVNQGVALAQTRRQQAASPGAKGTQFAGPGVPLQPAGGQQAPALPVPPIPPPGGPAAPSGGVMSPGELPGAAPPGAPPDTTTAPAVQAPQTATMATPPPDASVPDDKLSWPQFQQRHTAPPSLADIQRITVTTDPKALADATAEVADARKAQATAAQTYQVGLSTGKLDDKATSDFNTANERVATANQNYNKLVQDAATSTAANMLTYQKNQTDILAKQYADAQARAAAAALKTQEGQQKLAEIGLQGKVNAETEVQKGLNDSRAAAANAIDQIQLARNLSRQAGDPTFWQTVQKTHPDLVQAYANLGGMTEQQVQQTGAAGAADAAFQRLITMGKSGTGFSRLTNLDVGILRSQAPEGTDPQAWREAKLAYMQSYMERQKRYVDTVHSLQASGKYDLYEAQQKADTLAGDIVPQVPAYRDQPGNSAADQRKAWAAANNVEPGTFVRAPDGQLLIFGGRAAAPASAPRSAPQPVFR